VRISGASWELYMMPGDVQIVEQGIEYNTVWHVQPPANGQAYRVTRQEWSQSYDMRHIYAWTPA
jgi:hypothetical protein